MYQTSSPLIQEEGVSKKVDLIHKQTYVGREDEVSIYLSESSVHKEVNRTLFNLFDVKRDGRIDFAEVSVPLLAR
jgi:hypothetical protein